jgi:hypothetical protein
VEFNLILLGIKKKKNYNDFCQIICLRQKDSKTKAAFPEVFQLDIEQIGIKIEVI